MVRPIAFGTVTRDALPDQIAARLIDADHRAPAQGGRPAAAGARARGLDGRQPLVAARGAARAGDARRGRDAPRRRHLPDGAGPRRADEAGRARARAQRRRARGALRGAQARRARARRARRGAHRRRGGGRAVRCAESTPAALEDPEAFMWADIELHAQIARAASNAVLSRLLDSIAGMALASRRRTGRLAPRARAERARPSRDRGRDRGTRRGRGRAPRCCAIWRTSNGR